MTLTNRVSAFFLGWLALSFAGFALAIYLVARADLYGRAEDRLQTTIDAMIAATDIEPDGIEWEGAEHTLPRGDDSNAVIWLVATPGGRVIDRSGSVASDWLLADSATDVLDPTNSRWRVARRRLDAKSAPNRPPDNRTLAAQPNRVVKYAALDIVAAVPLTPIRDDLDRLAGILGGLTAFLWITAALVGRWLCRRTLAPVTEMAVSASGVGPSAPGERLAVRSTGDELEGLGRAFNGALDRLEEALERQRRFTGDAAHQLRTPLAVMLGQVEVALRRERPPEEYRRVLEIVAEQTGRLERIVEMLLFLARADAEAGLPARTCVHLVPWLRDHLRVWESHPRAADIRLAPNVDECLIAFVHAPLLGQVVDILLDNACKYSRPGSPITVFVKGDGEHVRLVVADDGCGIDASDLARVFDPFYRSPRVGELGVGGVGLGLTIARRVIEAMGGEIEAQSELGRGSRFTVQFPVHPPGGVPSSDHT
jgi:signal transduction histidine kinase